MTDMPGMADRAALAEDQGSTGLRGCDGATDTGAARQPVIMLIGEGHSGKSTVIQALTGQDYRPRQALAPVYFRNFVDTPGEFLENRRFYRSLITASMTCDILLFIQDATRSSCLLPPGFAAMFNRVVAGFVSKCDHEQANIARAEKFLRNAGVKTILHGALHTQGGADAVQAHLAALWREAGGRRRLRLRLRQDKPVA